MRAPNFSSMSIVSPKLSPNDRVGRILNVLRWPPYKISKNTCFNFSKLFWNDITLNWPTHLNTECFVYLLVNVFQPFVWKNYLKARSFRCLKVQNWQEMKLIWWFNRVLHCEIEIIENGIFENWEIETSKQFSQKKVEALKSALVGNYKFSKLNIWLFSYILQTRNQFLLINISTWNLLHLLCFHRWKYEVYRRSFH